MDIDGKIFKLLAKYQHEPFLRDSMVKEALDDGFTKEQRLQFRDALVSLDSKALTNKTIFEDEYKVFYNGLHEADREYFKAMRKGPNTIDPKTDEDLREEVKKLKEMIKFINRLISARKEDKKEKARKEVCKIIEKMDNLNHSYDADDTPPGSVPKPAQQSSSASSAGPLQRFVTEPPCMPITAEEAIAVRIGEVASANEAEEEEEL